MDLKEHKTDDRVEKVLDLGERKDSSLPRIGRRKALKIVLASAPVIITFTAGVAQVDAAGYGYLATSGNGTTTKQDGELEPVDSVDWSYKK